MSKEKHIPSTLKNEDKVSVKDKQIDEIAKLICVYPQCIHYNIIGECANKECRFVDKAEHLYNAGYRKQSEWISVEDRLPPKYEKVLVYCDGVRQLDFMCSNGVWYEHNRKQVTHWMPLPEAPKMIRKEDEGK